MIEIKLKAKLRKPGQFKATPYVARTGNRTGGPKDPRGQRAKRWSWQPPTIEKQQAARRAGKKGPIK